MARRPLPVFVFCNNVAQAGRLAKDLGTRHGQEDHDYHHDHHDLSGPRSTRQRQKGHHHHHYDHHHSHHELSGPRSLGASRSSAARVWKVYEGDTLYEVRDLGTRLEARSEQSGGVVWTAVRLPNGEYNTQSTAFSMNEIESFLEKVHDGDQITPGAHARPVRAQRAAPASVERAVPPPSAARARTTRKAAVKAHPKATRAERSAPASTTRGKSTTVKAAASATPKSKSAESATLKSKAASTATPRQTPKSKGQATATSTASGPSTSRSPGSQHLTPTSMRRHLHAMNPETPKKDLALLEDIWRGGASEPTRAWMLAQGFTDLAEAFVDWVEHHTTEAHGYMHAARAQRSA